jgi:putative oxidoreductase
MQKIMSTKGAWHIGILFVRVMAGIYIFRYGRELFHIDDLLKFLADTKWPLPVFSGYAAKIIELAGGVLLMLGLFTRIVYPHCFRIADDCNAGSNIYHGRW